MEQHEERWWEAEVSRLRGVLLLRQTGTPQAEAETWLQRALDVARRQEAKSLELRAAMSLSRLWQQQGKRAEAHELLAPIYSWFTEGFDTGPAGGQGIAGGACVKWGEAGFVRFTLEEIRQQYGESTPRRQFLFRRLQTVTRLLSRQAPCVPCTCSAASLRPNRILAILIA